jgi:hypothetical protein
MDGSCRQSLDPYTAGGRVDNLNAVAGLSPISRKFPLVLIIILRSFIAKIYRIGLSVNKPCSFAVR